MYIGLGIFLLVLGAILYFAVSASVAGISLSMVGVILMVGGGLAIVLSFVMQANRRSSGMTTTRETQVDPSTGSNVQRTSVDPN